MLDAVTAQDWSAFTEGDVTFHRALLRASGSLVVTQLADPIEAGLRALHKLQLFQTALSPDFVLTHRAILDAILRHDGAQAELASRKVVDTVGAEVMASLMGGAAASESGGQQFDSGGTH
jgi:DNA-binding FadR family transcriptional regulator